MKKKHNSGFKDKGDKGNKCYMFKITPEMVGI